MVIGSEWHRINEWGMYGDVIPNGGKNMPSIEHTISSDLIERLSVTWRVRSQIILKRGVEPGREARHEERGG